MPATWNRKVKRGHGIADKPAFFEDLVNDLEYLVREIVPQEYRGIFLRQHLRRR
jgi:hypothetical protein